MIEDLKQTIKTILAEDAFNWGTCRFQKEFAAWQKQ